MSSAISALPGASTACSSMSPWRRLVRSSGPPSSTMPSSGNGLLHRRRPSSPTGSRSSPATSSNPSSGSVTRVKSAEPEIGLGVLRQLETRIPVAARLEIDPLLADVRRNGEVVDLPLLLAGRHVLMQLSLVGERDAERLRRLPDDQTMNRRRHHLATGRLAGSLAVRAQLPSIEVYRLDGEVGVQAQLHGQPPARRSRRIDAVERHLRLPAQLVRRGIEPDVDGVRGRAHLRLGCGAPDERARQQGYE